MKIVLKKKQAAEPEPKSKPKVLEFTLTENSSGEILLSEVATGWTLLGLRVSEDQVTFFRSAGVEDENFLTDENGRLEEIDE